MYAHRPEYLIARKEFEFLVQEIITRVCEWDQKIPSHEPKHCIFRFNRDTRFSDNKKPYKENFGAFIAYGNRNAGLPGYYLHLDPQEVFVAGGVWMPEADTLARIRRHIAENGTELTTILKDKNFKKIYPNLDQDSALRRAPKGYPADHEFVEFLKLKSFTVHRPLEVGEVLRPGFGKVVNKYFKIIQPLNEFLLEGIKSKYLLYCLAFFLMSCASEKERVLVSASAPVPKPKFQVLTLDNMDDYQGDILQYVIDAPKLKNEVNETLHKSRELCKQGDESGCKSMGPLKAQREKLHEGLMDIALVKGCATQAAIQEGKKLTGKSDLGLLEELKIYTDAYQKESGKMLNLSKCD